MIYTKCINVALTETGEILAQHFISKDEDEFPGYASHVSSSYDNHPQYTVTVIDLTNGETHE